MNKQYTPNKEVDIYAIKDFITEQRRFLEAQGHPPQWLVMDFHEYMDIFFHLAESLQHQEYLEVRYDLKGTIESIMGLAVKVPDGINGLRPMEVVAEGMNLRQPIIQETE